MHDAIKLLESLLDDLPAEHHEKPGLIRAVEVLKDEHRSRQRTRVPVRPSAAGSRPEGGNEPKTTEDLLVLLVDLEHGIERASEFDPAHRADWTSHVMDLRSKVQTVNRALRDDAFPIETDQRQALRVRVDASAKTLLREFFGLSDEVAQDMIHPKGQ